MTPNQAAALKKAIVDLASARASGMLLRDAAKRHPNAFVRFWGNLVICPTKGCWLWDAAISKGSGGYGVTRSGAKVRYVHRVAYEAFNGPIPQDHLVLHVCDVPHCCNPDHLYAGSHADNSKDMVSRGRSRGALNPIEALIAVVHGAPVDEIAEALGVSNYSIQQILKGYRHSDITGIQPRGRMVMGASQ